MHRACVMHARGAAGEEGTGTGRKNLCESHARNGFDFQIGTSEIACQYLLYTLLL